MSTYSFLDVQAAISGPGGAFSLGSGSGNAEEGIDVEASEDKNTLTVGADGSPMHSLHAGKPGTITIRLLKTSPVNSQLDALYNFQTQNSAAHGQNVITVANPQWGDFISGQLCAFKKRPKIAYAKEGGMNEWVFDVGILDEQLGAGVPDVNI